MTPQTPLYYASIAGLTGICFTVGPTLLFAPCDAPTIHIVRDGAALVVTARWVTEYSLASAHRRTTRSRIP